MLRNLKTAWTAAGYDSLTDFAKDVGISRQAMSGKVNEKSDFTVQEARRVLSVLREKGVPADFDHVFLSDSPENGTNKA
jgi:DNA-binding XRE family transcriptional regulator